MNPLSTAEYAELRDAGVDGLTLYQEVYHQETYRALHVKRTQTRLPQPAGCSRAGL
ncbi:hypothetical protein ACFSQ7_36160 [Paenibacillus rhizoplanae]